MNDNNTTPKLAWTKAAASAVAFIATFSSVAATWTDNAGWAQQAIPLLLIVAAAFALAHVTGTYTSGATYVLGPALPMAVFATVTNPSVQSHQFTLLLIAAWCVSAALGATLGAQLHRSQSTIWARENSVRLLHGMAITFFIIVVIQLAR